MFRKYTFLFSPLQLSSKKELFVSWQDIGGVFPLSPKLHPKVMSVFNYTGTEYSL